MGGYQVATGSFFKFVFRLEFPFIVLTACLISWLFLLVFHMPEFGGWAELTMIGYRYASSNMLYFGLALAVAIGALLLAWVGWREHATQTSGVIKGWGWATIFTAIAFWLRVYWPWNGTDVQLFVYGFLLIGAWDAIFTAAMSSAKLVAQGRAKRPIPPPIWQQPHGRSPMRPQPHRSRNEPDTI